MSLEKPVILHTYKYGFGGIGDLFRSLISFHAVCAQRGLAFHITLEETPDFQQCFNLLPVPDFGAIPSEYRQCIADHRGNSFIAQVVEFAEQKRAIQRVASNISFLHNPGLITPSIPAFRTLIQPSALVRAKMEEVYTRYGLTPGSYASFHVRCGDVYMCKESGKGTSPDIRIILSPATIERYADYLRKFSEHVDLPILIHSDSNIFKKELQKCISGSKFIFLDMPIQHVANRLGDNTVDSYVSTVGEFYLLVHSAAVCMPNYSGFSHIASVLGDVPLYGPLAPNSEHQNLLLSLGPSKKYTI